MIVMWIVAGPASALQELDAPEYPNRSPRKESRSRDLSFELKGVIEIEKSPLIICSEGAASGEDLETAMKACDVAIAEEPESGNAHYYRGFVLYQLERYAEAEAAFTAAIDRNTNKLAESYYQRGACKEAQNRLRDASQDFRKAHELMPEWSAARRKVDEYLWAYQ